MANEEHLQRLTKDVSAWNEWRQGHPKIKINLNGAPLDGLDLRHADLSNAELIMACLNGADLRDTNLSRAILIGVHLHEANLRHADLSEADLSDAVLCKATLIQADCREANLKRADLSGADLRYANFREATLQKANLKGANLGEANLTGAYLVGADFRQAKLHHCHIYGISAWNLDLTGAEQSELIITAQGEPTITVDNLEVAQFIYLLLYNEKIRHIIDTITSKVVLILGRFTPEPKMILDAIREELRLCDYMPIVFDFEKPASRDLTETISTLAHMARFVIADITDAKSIPQELQRIVPDLPSVPIQPLLHISATEYGMFEHFRRYPWVLEVFHYDNLDDVVNSLRAKIIDPAEAKAQELRRVR